MYNVFISGRGILIFRLVNDTNKEANIEFNIFWKQAFTFINKLHYWYNSYPLAGFLNKSSCTNLIAQLRIIFIQSINGCMAVSVDKNYVIVIAAVMLYSF